LLSLPIPRDDSTYTYNDLFSKRKSLGSIIRDLSKGRIRTFSGYEVAHLDPDLDIERLTRDQGWKPIFGQHGGAQKHLENYGVAQDDLFLFFGWFKQTEYVNGALTYLWGSPDIHVIFGWLQIGEVKPVNEETVSKLPYWSKYHPHVARREVYDPNNTIYIAKENLVLNGERLPLQGGGVFQRFHRMLQLTWPEKNCPRSYWKLPHWFYPFHSNESRKPLSHYGEKYHWEPKGDHVLLRTVRGQEFVLDTMDYPEAIGWIKDIIKAVPNEKNIKS